MNWHSLHSTEWLVWFVKAPVLPAKMGGNQDILSSSHWVHIICELHIEIKFGLNSFVVCLVHHKGLIWVCKQAFTSWLWDTTKSIKGRWERYWERLYAISQCLSDSAKRHNQILCSMQPTQNEYSLVWRSRESSLSLTQLVGVEVWGHISSQDVLVF